MLCNRSRCRRADDSKTACIILYYCIVNPSVKEVSLLKHKTHFLYHPTGSELASCVDSGPVPPCLSPRRSKPAVPWMNGRGVVVLGTTTMAWPECRCFGWGCGLEEFNQEWIVKKVQTQRKQHNCCNLRAAKGDSGDCSHFAVKSGSQNVFNVFLY